MDEEDFVEQIIKDIVQTDIKKIVLGGDIKYTHKEYTIFFFHTAKRADATRFGTLSSSCMCRVHSSTHTKSTRLNFDSWQIALAAFRPLTAYIYMCVCAINMYIHTHSIYIQNTLTHTQHIPQPKQPMKVRDRRWVL
jgi:hypothetical protein